MNLISIVVPCYNEEDSIFPFYNEIIRVLENIEEDYEIIFINDGSKDNSLNKIKQLDNINYISFSRNFGKEAALYAGLKNSKGDYVVVIDVDLQDPPELILEMIDLIFKKVYVKISDLVELGPHRQTAAVYLDRLVDLGLLTKEKVGRENIYKNIRLLELFEGDSENE